MKKFFVLNTYKLFTSCVVILLFVSDKVESSFIRSIGRNYRKLKLTKSCECGLATKTISERSAIKHAGITYAPNHVWPWMASIVNITEKPESYCGASVISKDYILTAAHCIPDMKESGLSNFVIYLGTNYIRNRPDVIKNEIKEIKVHPSFDFDTADFDIALIALKYPLRFTKKVRPICLKQPKHSYIGSKGIIVGWGSYNLSLPVEDALKQTQVEVVSHELCRRKYDALDIPVTKNMLCANSKQAPCKGDSGSPMVILEPGTSDQYNQIGIISHGQGCATEEYPTIYSKVSLFIDWIQENTQDTVYCAGTF